jgi:SAM-dependent methyltransferase
MSDDRAPDGSPVDLYPLLPPGDAPALIHGTLRAGASILELGSGAGRLTHALLELGLPVTAVDQSAAMLANVRGAETVQADIETLELGRRFDAVLLASYLVNTVDTAQRAAFLDACRRHVSDTGIVLVERLDPRWSAIDAPSTVERDGVRSTIRDIKHDGALFSAVMEYQVGEQRWMQPFSARLLDDAELIGAVRAAGLTATDWLDRDRSWLSARPFAPSVPPHLVRLLEGCG